MFLLAERGKKIIPLNIGDIYKAKNGLVICTDNFSILDVVSLINVLIIKFDLNCTPPLSTWPKAR
jgi:hypothetical protein